jgi:hypothetical protein
MSTIAIQVAGFHGEVDKIAAADLRHDLYRYCVRAVPRGELLVSGYAGDMEEACDSIRSHVRYILQSAGATDSQHGWDLVAA